MAGRCLCEHFETSYITCMISDFYEAAELALIDTDVVVPSQQVSLASVMWSIQSLLLSMLR